jgi:hypothetical protein
MNELAGKAFILILWFFSSTSLLGQGNTTGSWNVINAKAHFNNNNGFVFFEAVLRAQKLTTDFYYHDLKTGIVYNPSDKIGFQVGVGDFTTYKAHGNFESPVQTELRTWEQLQLNSNINIIKLEHRYRLEQRFFSYGYRNRFRYRINTITPILKTKTNSNLLHVLLYDEIFLTDDTPIFEKNRWFAGVTYSFNKYFGMQVGWVHDFDLKKNSVTTTKNFLQTSLLFDIYAPHHARKSHPKSIN